MPIWADPRRGENVRLIADDEMNLLATFVAPPGVRPTAHDLAAVPGADLAALAAICVRDLPGVRVVTRIDEAAALAEAGADVRSALSHMVRQLDDPEVPEPPDRWVAPRLPAGVSMLGPLDWPGGPEGLARSLEPLHRVAYPPGHPDHDSMLEAQADGSLERLLTGDLAGPVDDDLSALLVDDATGAPLAVLVVVEFPPLPGEWKGGPWGCELFRTPGTAGPLGSAPVGRALLARAVAVAHLHGRPAIGLSVNAANPAKRVYERLGFRDAFHRVTLDLPGSWPAR